jgi:hypothetical protein
MQQVEFWRDRCEAVFLFAGNFITFGHFAISSAMNWPNGLASTASVSSRALKFGSAMPATIAAASGLICGTMKQRSKFLEPPQRPECWARSVARMGRDNDRGGSR